MENNKKAFYTKWWAWILVVLFFPILIPYILWDKEVIKLKNTKENRNFNKKEMAVAYILFFVFVYILLSWVGGSGKKLVTENSNTQANTTTEVSTTTLAEQKQNRENSEKEFVKIMDLAKSAKVVSSYNWIMDGDKKIGLEVSADRGWYITKADIKKNLLIKIGQLKKEITGYQNFKITDAYSGEVVGEITSFSGSVELYK